MRKRLNALALVAIPILSLAAAPATALRCGNRVVSEGDNTLKLIEYCGQPVAKEQFESSIPYEAYDRLNDRYYTGYRSETYEVWTYNFGPNRLMQRITVKEGIIEEIENAGRGY